MMVLHQDDSKLDWTTVRTKLRQIKYSPFEAEEAVKEAAVAIVFRDNPANNEVELLLIQRAKREGDPWSGHMAFPGGHVDLEDPSPEDAAIREAREEISLDLHNLGEPLGKLPQLQAMAKGKWISLVISPFLFELKKDPTFSLNHEVDAVVWIPLQFFLSEENRSTMMYEVKGQEWPLPCYRYKEFTVWGLTLRMIDIILENIRSPW